MQDQHLVLYGATRWEAHNVVKGVHTAPLAATVRPYFRDLSLASSVAINHHRGLLAYATVHRQNVRARAAVSRDSMRTFPVLVVNICSGRAAVERILDCHVIFRAV